MKAKIQSNHQLHAKTQSIVYFNPPVIYKPVCQKSAAYGKRNKLRCEQPSMFQILSWKNQPQFNQTSYTRCQKSKCRFYDCNNQTSPQQMKQHRNQVITSIQSKNKSKNQINLISKKQNQQQLSFRKDLNGDEAKKNPQNTNVKSSKQLLVKTQPNNGNQFKVNSSNKLNQVSTKNFTKKTITKAQSSAKLIKTNNINFSTPKNTITNNNPQARYLSPKVRIKPNIDQETIEHLRKQALKKFMQTTRDLSNSAYMTYFNKPPFESYGRGNTHAPGVLYGDYMYSHNIIPHTGSNKPINQQTYQTALIKAKSAGNIHPKPPLTKFQFENSLNYHTIGQIYPHSTTTKSIQIDKIDIQKLPKFSIQKQDQQNWRNYYIRDNMIPKTQFLTSDQVQQKIWKSNKDQIDGRQIQYQKKIQKKRKQSFQRF